MVTLRAPTLLTLAPPESIQVTFTCLQVTFTPQSMVEDMLAGTSARTLLGPYLWGPS